MGGGVPTNAASQEWPVTNAGARYVERLNIKLYSETRLVAANLGGEMTALVQRIDPQEITVVSGGAIFGNKVADKERHFQRAPFGVVADVGQEDIFSLFIDDATCGARSRDRIVVVSAGSSKQPAPGRGLFGAAKASVNVLMQAIAREHKADGIVANALVLGGVATEAARSYLSAEDLVAAATPQEVADALAFLASDHGSGVNGALVDLNAREVD
jgi:NAD(P)-dependent dehydrogenase (short-subunit alcohol dehydrogenase family)